jgi:Uma2 family endonuclease
MKPTQTASEDSREKPDAKEPVDLPVIHDDLPILYEDEGQEDMGESRPHTDSDHILSVALAEHFRRSPRSQVLSNLNVYYHPVDRRAYVSPDVMVVETTQPLPDRLSSYRLGKDRPPPILVIEILSRRSAQQQDLTTKPGIYAWMGVAEYILVDGTGDFLQDRLLLKRRVDDNTWEDEQDRDGGVTSRLGFRILIEDDELPRVIDVATGRRYPRPLEAQEAVLAAQASAQTEAEARRVAENDARIARAAVQTAEEAQRKAEQRLRDLEAELQRLRGEQPGGGSAR